jgi:hypothetical protein
MNNLSTDITRCWEFANHSGGALAEAVHVLRDGQSPDQLGKALVLLDEANRKALQASGHIQQQIAAISKQLATR